MEYTVWARGERIDFTSELTPQEALDILDRIERPSEFVASLINQCKSRGLSDRQFPWLIKLAQDEIDKGAALAKGVTYKPVVDLFNGIPMGRFQVRLENVSLKKPGSSSRNFGAVYLFQGNAYKGKITPEGVLDAWGLTPEAVEQLDAFTASPVEYVIKFGKETGQCSCCGRPLSDPVSVYGGIGPTCLERMAGKQARKIMQGSFVVGDDLIKCLARAGLLKTQPKEQEQAKEEEESVSALEREKFDSEDDFRLANAIKNL
jgi:hypothetical protein